MKAKEPTTAETAAPAHPLDPLSARELRRAVEILRADPRIGPGARFADVYLDEPDKDAVRAWAEDGRDRGGPAGPLPAGHRSRTGLHRGGRLLDHWRGRCRSIEVAGVCPTMLVGESWQTAEAVRADPRWQEAMRRRGIEDFSKVEVEPWPAGRFGLAEENGRRLGRAISYLREEPGDNQYARPIEGVLALVDLGRHEVLDVVDHGGAPVPSGRGRYRAADTDTVADRPVAHRDQPTGRSRFQPRGPRAALAEVVDAGLARRPTRDSSSTPSVTRTGAGSGPSSTGPRSPR